MTATPTQQLERREILNTLRAFRRGDFTVQLDGDFDGFDFEITQGFNEIVELNKALTDGFARLGNVVGKGRPDRRAQPCTQRRW